jgi:serralysin
MPKLSNLDVIRRYFGTGAEESDASNFSADQEQQSNPLQTSDSIPSTLGLANAWRPAALFSQNLTPSAEIDLALPPIPDEDWEPAWVGATSGAPSAASSTTVSRSGNQYVDGVLSGSRWNGPVTYSFPDAAADYANPYSGSSYGEPSQPGFAQVSLAQMQAVRHFSEGISGGPGSIFDPIEGFTNLNFTELSVGSGGADIMIAQSPIQNYARDSQGNPILTAYAYYPDNTAAAGDAWFGTHYNYRSPVLGDYEYETHIHEIGHTLGLKHGQETTGFGAVPADRDDLEFSVMTYRSYINAPLTGYTNETWGYPQTYMMLDIAALQYMYGADYTYDSGNTTYTWSPTTGEMFVNGIGQGAPGNGIGGAADRVFLTIWDGGGNDTYDMSVYTNSVSIDLNPGDWSITSPTQLADLDQFSADSTRVARGNVYNTMLFQGNTASLIENAIGGSNSDTITGNSADNTLRGGRGDDGIDGGTGADSAVFSGLRSAYTLTALSGNGVRVVGPDGTDTLTNIERLVFDDQTVTWPPPADTTPPSLVHESSLTLVRSGTATITSSLLQFDDNVSTHAQETYTVITGPAHGSLLRSGSATSSFTQADIDTGLISYHEDGSAVSSDSFTFRVTDAANNQTTGQTFQFNITPPADTTPPSLVHESSLPLVRSGTATITSSLLQFDDNVSTHAQETYTVITGPAHGSLLRSGLATSSFTQADIDTGLISYHEDGSAVSSDSFTFRVTDAANNQTTGQTFPFNITAPPDTTPPSLVHESSLTLARGGTGAITSSLLQFDDNVSTHAQETYTSSMRPRMARCCGAGWPHPRSRKPTSTMD